jgi:Fic family protein
MQSEETMDASVEDRRAVAGYQQAMTYVLQLAKRPRLIYTSEVLCALHYMMLSHDLGKHPGNRRPGPISVQDLEKGEVVYDGPDVEQVPPLITELVGFLNERNRVSPVVTAAMAHLNLVMIHPFSDGNGRMSRCLQSLVLARHVSELDPAFVSIEDYLGRHTRAYYDALDMVGRGRWNASTDTRPWIRFCLTAHYHQAVALMRRWQEYQKLWDALELEMTKYGLPDRTMFAMSDAALGLRVRNATYRNAADISSQVASRDLTDLVRCGLLSMEGRARGACYVATPVIRQIAARCKEPRPTEDPTVLPLVKPKLATLPLFDS